MTPAPPRPSLPSTDSEIIAFLKGRSVPCPRCAYDLRDIQTPICPECAEPLFLTVGTAKPRFGYLILAMAPGCFSGVAACFVFIPIFITIWQGGTLGRRFGVPWPVVFADLFGFLSAASVVFMYKHRHRIMSWPDRRQMFFAIAIWLTHIGAFALFLLWMWLVAP